MKLVASTRRLPMLLAFAAAPLLALNAPSGCQEMTCQERAEAATDYVYSAVEENLACTTDSDCTTVVPSTDCMGACPVPVSVDGLDAVLEAIDYANATWCDTYAEDGCPYATPDCLWFVPVCENGICVAQYEEPVLDQ